MDLTLSLRTALPEFYSGWDPLNADIQQVLGYGCVLPLPGYDHHGRKVVLIRTAAHDPAVVKQALVQRVSFMTFEVMNMEEEQLFVMGIVLVFDFSGYTTNHFLAFPLADIKKSKLCWEVNSILYPFFIIHSNYIN